MANIENYEADLKAKLDALSRIEKQLSSDGESPLYKILEGPTADRMQDVLSTGAISLDLALGVGGIPRGKIVELYGPEGSGKSTLALSIVKEAQKRGGVAVYIDAENVLDPEYAQALGIDLDRLWISQPSSGEEGFKVAEAVLEENAADVVVFDSVAAMVPRAELEGDIGDMKVGRMAAMMSQALRRLNVIVGKSNAVVIFINQIRMDVGGYGNPETTPGGKALKYYSSVRLDIRSPRSNAITKGKEQIGQVCKVTVRKNKVGPPFKTAEFALIYGKGIDGSDSLVDALIQTGLWQMKGSWVYDTLTNANVAQGKAKAADLLASDPELAELLTDTIYAAIRGDDLSEYTQLILAHTEDDSTVDEASGDTDELLADAEALVDTDGLEDADDLVA